MSLVALGALVGKDLKMFFRSKISSIVVVLIPLIIILFAGFAFGSNGLSNVQAGVYSSSYTDFTNSIIDDFSSEGFSSFRYDSAESCIDSVKYSESQVCVIFPAQLTSDVNSEEIVFYVDYSRANLADNLINKIKGRVLVRTSGVSEGIAEGLISSLDKVKEVLPINKKELDSALALSVGNSNIANDLEIDYDSIDDSVDELKDVKDELNSTKSKAKIDEMILTLEKIKEDGESVEDSIEKLDGSQKKVLSKLDLISLSLDELIISLNDLEEFDASEVSSPIKTRVESVSLDSSNQNYIIPIVLSLIALFGAILLSSTFVLKAKKTRAFFRNFMTPTKDIVFLFSTYLSCMIILIVQFILVFVGLRFVFGMDVISMIGPLSLTLFMSLSVFVSLGMFIGYLFRSDETIVFASMIIGAVLMFFSNVILPLEKVSSSLLSVLKFNPLVVSNLALKKVVLFNFGPFAIVEEVLILLSFFVLFFFGAYLFRRITRRDL